MERGSHVLVKVLHPEYKDPVSEFVCRCVQCGQLSVIIQAFQPATNFLCQPCLIDNRRLTAQQRVNQGLCAHCSKQWDDVENALGIIRD